jgi:4-hydroxy-tetrahydrodipicolinate synthase
MVPADLKGIIPPVSTPMTAEDEVSVPDLERLLDFHLDAGVHGLFMLGSTSETIGLTDAQQELVVATAIRKAKGRVPVLAGALDFTTNRVIDRAKRHEALGVDGHVVLSPFYIKPSPAEIVRHYIRIAEVVSVPVMAYDIPGAIQTKLDRGSVRTLAKAGAIIGLKDSSGQEANFRGVILDNGDLPEFRVFTGSELLADVALTFGAAGVVPGLGNVDPSGYVRLYDAFVAGDLATMRAEQDRLYGLFAITQVAQRPEIGWSAAAWGGFKAALVARGVLSSAAVTAPMSSLTGADMDRIRAIVQAAGLETVA